VFICILKGLIDNFLQNWNSELVESLRANYVLFCNFRLQPYIKCINIEKFRMSLSRLRMSSQRLKVETGSSLRPYPLDRRPGQVVCRSSE